MRITPLLVFSMLLICSCVPAIADDNAAMQAGEEMIVNAVSQVIVNFANSIVTGIGGVETGKLDNSSNYSGEQVAIFAVAAHTIDPLNDPGLMQEVENTKEIYTYGMVILGILLTLFLLFQAAFPGEASNVVGAVRGQPGYATIGELGEYYITVGLWFLAGPAILYGSIYLNNYFVESMTLSVLDHVAFSSENGGFYLFMVTLWACMVGFFAERMVLILVAVKIWYLFGLILAYKRIRWLGVMLVPYTLVFVFAQAAIVGAVVYIVTYISSNGASWIGSGFLYIGLFLMILGIVFVVVCWPILLKFLKPDTYRTIIQIARYI